MREARKNKTRTIAVFGVGPGLGQAVARRYARAGYSVVLVARRREPLEHLANERCFAAAQHDTRAVGQIIS
jgi:NAD(P)-dependent dehydrogenase (short-subunit alcohol dehydrogenase family)